MRWKKLLATGSWVEAMIVCQLLQQHGFTCRVDAPTPYRVFPFRMDGSDWYRVEVVDHEWADARSLLEAHRNRRPWLEIIRSSERSS